MSDDTTTPPELVLTPTEKRILEIVAGWPGELGTRYIGWHVRHLQTGLDSYALQRLLWSLHTRGFLNNRKQKRHGACNRWSLGPMADRLKEEGVLA